MSEEEEAVRRYEKEADRPARKVEVAAIGGSEEDSSESSIDEILKKNKKNRTGPPKQDRKKQKVNCHHSKANCFFRTTYCSEECRLSATTKEAKAEEQDSPIHTCKGAEAFSNKCIVLSYSVVIEIEVIIHKASVSSDHQKSRIAISASKRIEIIPKKKSTDKK